MLKKYVFLGLLLAFLPNTGRTLMVKLDLENLTQNSNLVIRATVENMRCSWDTEHRRIFTFATLAVKEPIKGNSPTGSINITYPGGVVGDIAYIVEDTPQFRPGEEVIVFLKDKNPEGLREVYGWFQGKYTIENNVVRENRLPVQTFLNQIKVIVQEQERGVK
jgi:hypothetical protein